MIGNDINRASEILKHGGLVAIPTETVYGLAANAFSKEAVLKIFEAKNRPFFDPLIIHTDTLEKVKLFTTAIPDKLLKLAEVFMPGPLTLLLPKKNNIPDIVTSGLPNVAVRIPNHPKALALLAKLDFPLAAPSANPFGYVSPTTAAHVELQLGNKIDYILDGGECTIGIESTIVGMQDGEVLIYRLGGLAIEDIERVVGKVELSLNQSSNPTAPGMLKSHYAPKKKLIIDDVLSFVTNNKSLQVGIISFQTNYVFQNAITKVLSLKGDTNEAAHNLFATLRFFDHTNVDVIVAEKLPENFLGRAINDRLKRASAE